MKQGTEQIERAGKKLGMRRKRKRKLQGRGPKKTRRETKKSTGWKTTSYRVHRKEEMTYCGIGRGAGGAGGALGKE